MTLGVVLLLFLGAAIIWGLDFLMGFTTVDYARWRVHSLALCLMAVAFLLWHGGVG
jgi:hypothetical protein